MKRWALTFTSISLLALALVQTSGARAAGSGAPPAASAGAAPKLVVARNGSQASTKGPAENRRIRSGPGLGRRPRGDPAG